MLNHSEDRFLDELQERIDLHISELADRIVERSLDASVQADEGLVEFYEGYDEQDALEGVDTPICDEASCPVAEVCPFGPVAAGLSEDEVFDILESCELTRDRIEGPHGMPGLEDALEDAGWPVYHVGSE